MISKADFDRMDFLSHGPIEPRWERTAQRIPLNMKLPNGDLQTLRNAIHNLVHDVKDKRPGATITSLVTQNCNIPYPTYKQYMSGGRRPTRTFIAKLAVGLELSPEEANRLFILHSGELNLTNDVDFITYYALKTHDDIFEYEQQLMDLAGIND